MTITTSSGKTLDVNYIWPDHNGRVMIELKDDRPLAEVAADFEGVKTLIKTDARKPGVEEIYTGYTQLIAVSRDNYEGVTRLIIKKGDAA